MATINNAEPGKVLRVCPDCGRNEMETKIYARNSLCAECKSKRRMSKSKTERVAESFNKLDEIVRLVYQQELDELTKMQDQLNGVIYGKE